MKTIGLISLGALILLFASGCASTKPAQNATVCPDCRTVTEEVAVSDHNYDDATQTVLRHVCKGCQGALATFFKEGKLKHTCSICTQEGYTCPVVHPVAAK